MRKTSGRGRARGVGRATLVELQPLREVTGVVTQGETTLTSYRLLGVTAGKARRVYWGQVGNGRYSVSLPEGEARLVIGTVDGEIVERSLTVAASDEAQAHDVVLVPK